MAMKARVFVAGGKWFDFPIGDGNTFANWMMVVRQQEFALDGTINCYVPLANIQYAFGVELIDPVSPNVTRQ
jgi:hypothetical protein